LEPDGSQRDQGRVVGAALIAFAHERVYE